jgi:hypothetical protein
MAAASSVGIMGECFFVGRTELLGWINSLLGLNLTKVEAVRCSARPGADAPCAWRRGVQPAGRRSAARRHACCGAAGAA